MGYCNWKNLHDVGVFSQALLEQEKMVHEGILIKYFAHFKVDDDTFVHVEQLVQTLQVFDGGEPLYLGNCGDELCHGDYILNAQSLELMFKHDSRQVGILSLVNDV